MYYIELLCMVFKHIRNCRCLASAETINNVRGVVVGLVRPKAPNELHISTSGGQPRIYYISRANGKFSQL